MSIWSVVFLVIALICGVLGFSGFVGASAWVWKVMFVSAVTFLVISLIMAGEEPEPGEEEAL